MPLDLTKDCKERNRLAQLDKFIRAMLNQGGSELWLKTDAEPVLLHGDRKAPLTSKRPTAQQVRHLAGEVVPRDRRSELAERDELQFSYDVPGGGSVELHISAWATAPCIIARVAVEGTELELDVPDPATKVGVPGAPLRTPLKTTLTSEGDPGSGSGPTPPRITSDRPPIDALFELLVESRSSDLHISSNEVPMIRKDGEMLRINYPAQPPEKVYELLKPIMPEKNLHEFESDGDTDFAYAIEGLARFRANMFRDRHGVGAVFRTIPAEILTAEQLGLSAEIQGLSRLSKGLVLVTGPTGSGKSTTLCALIDLINRTRSAHIITIEDPIEFVHENKLCLINQREVGVHTQGFKRALRAALREDPDIVLVGEMRDLETIAIAIETAETGHLVFGTLHTSTAYSTIDRIIDQFPPDQQEQIRVMLSESLRGVISQTLCKKVGGGRVAALEVLLSTPAVANLIREGKTFQIPSIMQTNRKMGMVLLNEALTELVKARTITADEAMLKAVDKATLKGMLQNAQVL